jgi:hypothetical protein
MTKKINKQKKTNNMKKVYESINAKIFSMPVVIGGKEKRLYFIRGDSFSNASYVSEDADEQKAIEKSKAFSLYLRIKESVES